MPLYGELVPVHGAPPRTSHKEEAGVADEGENAGEEAAEVHTAQTTQSVDRERCARLETETPVPGFRAVRGAGVPAALAAIASAAVQPRFLTALMAFR
jgi:hypothetical protein